MILRIVEARPRELCLLELGFNDGMRKIVNLRPLLHGPIFELLLDADYIGKVALDPCCGTVVWPNGADCASEALHELPSCISSKYPKQGQRKKQVRRTTR